MNRTEFLAALALRLEDLPEDERDEAVKYYSEYLDEVGMDGEDAAIAELGGAEKVSNIIRANCGLGPYRPAQKAAPQPELTLDGPSYAQAVENTAKTAAAAAQAAQVQAEKTAQAAHAAAPSAAQAGAASAPVPPTYTAKGAQAFQGTQSTQNAANAGTAPIAPPVYTSSSGNPFAGQAPDARDVYRAASAAGQSAPASTVPPTYGGSAQPQYNQNNSRVLWILIIVASSPIWLGLLGGLFGLVFGIFGTFIGLVFSGFGTFIAGIVHAAVSIPLFFSAPATAISTIGMSLLAAGIGALLGGGMLYASCKVFPWIWRTIGSIFGWLRGKVSGHNV